MAWLVKSTVAALTRLGALTERGSSKLKLRFLSSSSSDYDDDDDDGDVTAVSTARFVNHVIQCHKNTGIVYRSLSVICSYTNFDTCSVDTKLKVLSKVFDGIRNYPQADPYEVFLMKIFLSSMRNNDSKYDLSEEEVKFRVLDVVQSYPKIGPHYKVTEKTHFGNDLGFDEFDYNRVHKALYLEFKLYFRRSVMEGFCKELIDYIYHSQLERNEFEWFQKKNIMGDVFWPGPLR